MIRLLPLAVLLLGATSPAAACDWASWARTVTAGESGVAPATPLHLFFQMAEDPARAERVLERVGPDDRCQTRRLLEQVSLPAPEARRRLPQIHVVHDLGPGPGERPPTWPDLQVQGLRLLRAIAPDHSVGRDQRLLRELERAAADPRRDKPSAIAGRVALWNDWWADRGDDPSLYDDPALIPDVSPWVEGLAQPVDAGGATVADLLRPLVDDRLRRRLLVTRLDATRHEGVVAECIHWLRHYQDQFEEAGFAAPRWDPDTGRRVGYHASDLREVCLDLLAAVVEVPVSGADQDEVIVSWLAWWRRARFEARFYRDPTQTPSLAPWLAPLASPASVDDGDFLELLKRWYVAEGFRDLLLDRLGAEHAHLVADLIRWSRQAEGEAIAVGYSPATVRRPLRPEPGLDPPVVRIPWASMQSMMREMLTRITGPDAPADLGAPRLEEELWADWWRQRRHESRWYRAGQTVPEAPPRFQPERARSTG